MGPAIALRLRQHLTLTPQVQQALRLLQMSALEFAQEMEQALTANPFLEENGETPAAPRDGASSLDDVVVPQESSSPGVSDRDQEEWAGLSDAQPPLREHLRGQLMISQMGSRDRALAHMIIDSLDDDGYFKHAFDELAALVPSEHDVRPEDFSAALRLVQSLEPAGVAARTLEECLELQLAALEPGAPGRECALKMVRGRHLQLLGNREWARLQHAVGCDEATLHTARALIRTLDPKPGHRFGAPEARYVVPDVIVKKMRERWVAMINPASLPRVRLNRAYADAIQSRGNSNQSLSRQLQEARWLLRSIEQRFATIQRVADAIVARQRGFFEYGEVAMKPLTLKLIAGELGLHESTVCRVTNSKYMATPRGLFEFKHFFSRRLATESGGAASATAVRAVMKELIAAEDPRAPLSDAELARLLAQQGLRVARRTITKYRALMRLPSVDVRRADLRR
ncbi:MAG: RNA polymerase sigma-54 factor [Betaproteobacteria bacterium RIFCSPLOWO2_12_FULL_65_14]|nr:MAG: RNA polymerase sigma-54 factor [Betaproteobacteria bacterium RIFCSPLOWO2_12_FULL_65_14]